MADPEVINPESTILQQTDGQWQKLAMMIISKLAGFDKVVSITMDDMEKFQDQYKSEGGIPMLFTYGTYDSINFSIVSSNRAEEIAAFGKTMEGGNGQPS